MTLPLPISLLEGPVVWRDKLVDGLREKKRNISSSHLAVGWSNPESSSLSKNYASLIYNVHVERCDVAEYAQVQRLGSLFGEVMPPIRGVIHGAMALYDELLKKTTNED